MRAAIERHVVEQLDVLGVSRREDRRIAERVVEAAGGDLRKIRCRAIDAARGNLVVRERHAGARGRDRQRIADRRDTSGQVSAAAAHNTIPPSGANRSRQECLIRQTASLSDRCGRKRPYDRVCQRDRSCRPWIARTIIASAVGRK
jgi:hypothetical protein